MAKLNRDNWNTLSISREKLVDNLFLQQHFWAWIWPYAYFCGRIHTYFRTADCFFLFRVCIFKNSSVNKVLLIQIYIIMKVSWILKVSGDSILSLSQISTIKPFKSNVAFLYPLKTSENLWFSDVFRGYRNVTLD